MTRPVALLLAASLCLVPRAARTQPCDAPFPDAAQIAAWNQVMADFGPRPTASAAHRKFVSWLRRQVRAIPGMIVERDLYSIRRQLERTATLHVGGMAIPTAGPVPYARLTGRGGVEAPMTYLPPATPIGADMRGRIVVRDHVPVGVPYSILAFLSAYIHDPAMTLAPDALYERDYLAYQPILADIRAAEAAGAAGLVIVHEFPREQVAGQYQPYEGIRWAVPALYLGVDEGAQLKHLLETAPGTRGTIALTGHRRNARTQNLIATLPGAGPERIIVESHTDGMNAIWDNGPIAMLALAHWFARLPVSCRPRTLEFAFNTAHLHLAEHGIEHYGESLVETCDTIALAIAIEHLGAREYVAETRDDGPGRRLVSSGFPEFLGMFMTPSPALVDATIARVVQYDLQRTGVLHFIPGVVSGEGGAFDQLGIPAIAVIAGPWTLYNPSFGMEAVDVEHFRRQALALRDLIVDVQSMSRETIAGGPPCVPPGDTGG